MERIRHPASLHSPEQSRRWSYLVFGYLAASFYLTGWIWPRAFREIPELSFYLVQPLMWSGLALLAYIGWRRLPDRPVFHWSLVRAGVLVGLFHLSVLVIAGVVVGFGRSGAGNKLINYPLNALYLGTLLGGLEMTRAYLFAVWKSLSSRAAPAVVTVLIFVAGTPVSRFLALDYLDRFFRIGGGLLVPALVVSGVATWMVARSGPGPAFSYQAVLLIPDWFSPIQPRLSWVVLLLIGTGAPLVALALFRGLGEEVLPEETEHIEQQSPGRSWIRWTAYGAAVVAIVGFFAGTFGVRPYVISGISMEPALETGDVVLLNLGFDPASLESGDIVKYDRGVLPVVHRVVSVEGEAGGVIVTTKGDNVLSPDPPVDGRAIDGKVVFAIPWIGKIALWARGD